MQRISLHFKKEPHKSDDLDYWDGNYFRAEWIWCHHLKTCWNKVKLKIVGGKIFLFLLFANIFLLLMQINAPGSTQHMLRVLASHVPVTKLKFQLLKLHMRFYHLFLLFFWPPFIPVQRDAGVSQQLPGKKQESLPLWTDDVHQHTHTKGIGFRIRINLHGKTQKIKKMEETIMKNQNL